MKLDDFLKRDILDFLNALDTRTQKDSQAANDDTAFLLSSKESMGEKIDLNSNEFDGVSLDIDLFPEESSSENYVEPSALTSSSVDAPKIVADKVYAQSSSQQQTHHVQNVPSQHLVSNSVPSQVPFLSKTQIKHLVEEELQSKMSQFNSSVPSNKEVVESDHKEAIIRLKNELVDLKTIVNQLQIQKDEVISNQNKLSKELKESELHSQELILNQAKNISENNSIIAPVVAPAIIKEETPDNKKPLNNKTLANKDVPNNNNNNDNNKTLANKKYLNQNKNDSVDEIKNSITNESKDLKNQSSKFSSFSNSGVSNPDVSNPDVFHIKKSLPTSLPKSFSKSTSESLSSSPSSHLDSLSSPSSSSLSTLTSNSVSSQEVNNSSLNSSFKENVLKEKKKLSRVPIKIPKLVLPKRSKELPEVLFIEEELHKLRLALNNDNTDLAKKLYSSIKKRASKLSHHDAEKEVIHSQLQQVALILSFKLKGQVQSKKSFGKDLIPTKIKPTVLISSDDSSNNSFDSSSMKNYLEALTALKRKEKAKSLELLLQLNDLYPSHLGIKLRLQQALAL